MLLETATSTTARLLATAGLALSLAILPLTIFLLMIMAPSAHAGAGPRAEPGACVLPIVALDTSPSASATALETAAADRERIGMALETWQLAWSREGSRKQFGDLEQLYIAGEALRTLALARGFRGWQVAWMNVERIQVAGDTAISSAIVLRQNDGGYRVLHTWRKENGAWRILNEIVLAPS